MTGQVYSSSFDGVTVAAVQDLFEIIAGSTVVVELLSFHLSQEQLIQDAEEEMWTIAVQGHSGGITTGSGGSTPAMVPTNLGMAAAASVVEANNTTEISGGTAVTHHIMNWNVRVPLDLIWIPETRLWASPTDALTITLLTTPTSATVGGTMYFREYGGV